MQKAEEHAEFFKVYIPELSSQRLRIPPAYMKSFDGNMPKEAFLRDCTGKVWNVKLKETVSTFLIEDGWKSFVKDQHVEFGDFLIFKYDGRSTFDVKVFGKTGCKKENPFADIEAPVHVKEDPDVKAEEVHNKPARGHKKKSSKNYHVNGNLNGSPEIGRGPRGASAVNTGQPYIMPSPSTSQSGINKTEETHNMPILGRKRQTSEIGHNLNENLYVSPEVGHRSRPRRASAIDSGLKVIEAAGIVAPKNPYFVASLDPAALYVLRIPNQLLVEKDIILYPEMKLRDQTGRVWPVRVSRVKGDQIRITKGWTDIWKEYSLGPEDKCLFEFVRNEERVSSEIKVQIFRAKEMRRINFKKV